MIILFGQPGSGKTTLANKIADKFKKINANRNFVEIVDGDKVREAFNDTDYSHGGRLINSRRIAEIGHYLERCKYHQLVIISSVLPYSSSRLTLKKLNSTAYWVYLTYNEDRGKNQYQVSDFEEPNELHHVIRVNTSEYSEDEAIDRILVGCDL